MHALVIPVIEPDLVARPSVLCVRLPRRPPSAQTSARFAAVRVAMIAPAVDPERRCALPAFSLSDLQVASTRPNWTPSPTDRILRGICRLGGLAAPEGSELVTPGLRL